MEQFHLNMYYVLSSSSLVDCECLSQAHLFPFTVFDMIYEGTICCEDWLKLEAIK